MEEQGISGKKRVLEGDSMQMRPPFPLLIFFSPVIYFLSEEETECQRLRAREASAPASASRLSRLNGT